VTSFRAWAERDHWTPHAWMREEVLERADTIHELLTLGRQSRSAQRRPDEEEPLCGGFHIRSGSRVSLHEMPNAVSRVVSEVGSGQTLRIRARSGLWVCVTHRERQAWLLTHDGRESMGCLINWDILRWEPP